MSDLVAIAYDNVETAQQVAANASEAQKAHLIDLEDMVVVERQPDGKVKLHQPSLAGHGAVSGALWGGLIGLIFFVPFFGMAIGAGLGALMGKLEKSGIDREFQEQVRDLLQPGTSALFLVVEKVTPDKAVEALRKYGGTVLKSSLSKEAEEELQEELHGSKQPVAV